jgi:hypothetical protein
MTRHHPRPLDRLGGPERGCASDGDRTYVERSRFGSRAEVGHEVLASG